MAEAPGRHCPVSYRYGGAALGAAGAFETETLWIAGGLYGNRFALARLLELFDAEPGPKALVCNGDFHWFDVDADEFAAVQSLVLAHRATRGNVETELADPGEAAGCGCAYPDWVADAEVARSNRIIERLRRVARAQPESLTALGRLPMHLAASVAGARIAIVHGDADSLAGWGFAQERLATAEGRAAAREALRATRAQVIASSHTCLPVLHAFDGDGVIVNNGAAGMPNFHGTQFGIATRISVRPGPGALYAARHGALHIEARAIDFDAAAWRRRFAELWPAGSDADASYHSRIVSGPCYHPDSALRYEAAESVLRAA